MHSPILFSTHHTQPMILGHRGARAVHLENSVSGFVYACNLQGIAGVEFDVQLTLDNELAVFHDDNLVRLTGDQSELGEMSLVRLQTHPIHHQHRWHMIPSLREIAPYLNGYRYIELEIKTTIKTDYHRLVHAITKALPHLRHLPITLTSFDVRLLERLQHLDTPKGLLVETDSTCTHTIAPHDRRHVINTAQRLGCTRIGWHYPLIDETTVKLCHRYNIAISAWTVNDIDTAKYLASLGVDVIISDNPQSLINAIL
ncbi:MAG: glycerophosphodiester phosphodiesterase [Moraxella sp.]|nr:glycerophosphodiester phosphodiesterase [Moraxella sp.]